MIKNITKICPDGTELNPITNRCNKICKVGTIRSLITGKCEKIPNNNVKRGRKKKDVDPKQPKTPNQSPKPNKSSSSEIGMSPSPDRSPTPSPTRNLHSSSSKDFELYYPHLDDPDFTIKISNNKEFLIHKIPDYPVINNVKDFDIVSTKLCGQFDKMLYQHFISQYISYRTPYKSALLYHGVGVGKTCSAITISEAFLSAQTTSEPMIWVIMPQSLKTSFKSHRKCLRCYNRYK